jgi:hypothetical protein
VDCPFPHTHPLVDNHPDPLSTPDGLMHSTQQMATLKGADTIKITTINTKIIITKITIVVNKWLNWLAC